MVFQEDERLKAVEKYVFENIYKDKRHRDWGFVGSISFDGGDQVLYKFNVAPWDIVRGIFIIFEIHVLVDRHGQVLDKAVYDNRQKKIEPPVLTERIVDVYLKRQADRDMRQNFVNRNVIIRSM